MTAAFVRRSRLRWVNQLMHPERKEWNEGLIRQIFHPFDADEICKLAIPSSDAEDRIAWHYEKNGIFSVKSAYNLAMVSNSCESSKPSSSSRESNDRSIWDLIWKAKVPGKVRIFGWRIATNTLATKRNKWKRTLEIDDTCNICGNGAEDEYHAMIACTKSRALRFAMRENWSLPPEENFWFTGEDWLQVLLDTETEDMRAKILLLLWRCWFLREDCIRGAGKESILGSAQFLIKYEEELRSCGVISESRHGKNADDLTEKQSHAGDVLNMQWSPPVPGTVKINSDASFLAESGQSTAGIVARDSRGLVFISVCKRLPICSSAEEAEARAVLVGLNAMADFFRGPIVLEMDYQMIAKELTARAPSRSPCYALIMDIKKAMAGFPSCNISCVRRTGNSLAHGLAAEARRTGDQQLIAGVPDNLKVLMQSECISLPE